MEAERLLEDALSDLEWLLRYTDDRRRAGDPEWSLAHQVKISLRRILRELEGIGF